MGAVRRLTALAAGAVLAAGCTTAPGARPAAEPTTPRPSGSPDPTVPAPATQEPLVLAVPAARAPMDLTLQQARRLTRHPPPWAQGLPASALDASAAVATVDGVDPLLDPADYPLTVDGPEPGRVTTLRIVGDIMLGRGVAQAQASDDPVAALRPLADHLDDADLTVGNLESTLSTAGPPQQGGDSFAVSPAVPAALAALGVDAVSLANNHTGDFGTAALLDTVAGFAGSGLRAFGAGRDRSAAARPVVLTRHGVRFGFIGFNAIGETPRATRTAAGALSVRMPPRTGPLDREDLAGVLAVVHDLQRRADVVVVLPHWGTQYTHVAEPVQTSVGRRLVRAGADLVVGGHPHWVQGLEHVATETGGAVLAHSLGNLVFDMDFMEQTMEGVTLTATFWGDRLMRVTLTPYRMDARFSPRLVEGPVAAGILADVWDSSTGPFRRR